MRDIEQIRRTPFGDLTPEEQGEWMRHDPDTYWPAAWAHARVLVEQDVAREVQRQRERSRDRRREWLRRFWAALRGGAS